MLVTLADNNIKAEYVKGYNMIVEFKKLNIFSTTWTFVQ